ncbi:DUF2304 domain-containing protein [Clostridium sp. HCP1S3_B4]|uniref:DUF2304 domain-containing protein n=1 Tax=unclassified Clostridium TaxID=2614128 RepID=UPI0016931B42|nr:DUF2304 domain-containing protein [Clostridiales bacterium]MDY2730130.1 DUF2304 domain-containing protein [Clostridium sp.]NLK24758.1 DUF2304 domain-containing protein [Clostridiales bacterium]
MAPTRIFFTILSLIFSVLVICKVRKRRFFEKDSFMWLIGCFVMLILGLFPTIVIRFANIIGIEYAPSLLFLVAIVFAMFLLFRYSQEVSKLKEETKELGERIVVLEKLLDEKQNEKKDNGQ